MDNQPKYEYAERKEGKITAGSRDTNKKVAEIEYNMIDLFLSADL